MAVFTNARIVDSAPLRGGSRSPTIASRYAIDRGTAATLEPPDFLRGAVRSAVLGPWIHRDTPITVGYSNDTTISAIGKENAVLRHGARHALLAPFIHRTKFVTIFSFFKSFVVTPPNPVPIEISEPDEPRKWPKDYIKRMYLTYKSRWNL